MTQNTEEYVFIAGIKSEDADNEQFCVIKEEFIDDTYTDNVDVVKIEEECVAEISEIAIKTEEIDSDSIQSTAKRKTEPKNEVCEYCKHKFARQKHLWDHIRSKHTFEKPFNCDSCGKSFASSVAWSRHKKEDHSCNSYICRVCNKDFKSKRRLSIHTWAKHDDPETWKYVCEQCNQRFYMKSKLHLHIKKHLEGRSYVCSLCDKGFYCSYALNRHTSRSHASGAYTYKCDLCIKEYEEPHSLAVHKEKVHNVESDMPVVCEKKFSCEICSKKFTAKSNLHRHMVCHAEVNLNCTICDKKLANPYSLKVHVRGHDGEKRFKCTICGSCFSTKWVLKRHVDGKHVGNK